MNLVKWPLRICSLAAWVTAIILILFVWQEARAADLAIVGSANGIGLHNLTVSGDWINATIHQAGNASTWSIQTGGWP